MNNDYKNKCKYNYIVCIQGNLILFSDKLQTKSQLKNFPREIFTNRFLRSLMQYFKIVSAFQVNECITIIIGSSLILNY